MIVSALLGLLWVWPYLPTLRARVAALVALSNAAVPTPPASLEAGPALLPAANGVAPPPALRFIHEMLANERPLDYLKLARTQWRADHLEDTDAYIEIGVWLRYAGLFPLDIGREVSGGIGYAGRIFNLTPELNGTPVLHLERGDEVVLLLRQRLFAFEAATLRTALASGNEVELSTESLRLSGHAITPPENEAALAGLFQVGSRISNRDPEDRVGEF